MIGIFQAFVAKIASSGKEEFEQDWDGEVESVVKPGRVWRVKYEATSWNARSLKPLNLKVGDVVRVVKRQGLLLWIEPVEDVWGVPDTELEEGLNKQAGW